MWRFQSKGTALTVVDKIDFKLKVCGNSTLLTTDNKCPFCWKCHITHIMFAFLKTYAQFLAKLFLGLPGIGNL